MFAGVLVLESLPFLSAVAIAILENSRVNAFSFWRSTGVRTAELIGLRPVAMPTVFGAWWVGVDRSSREARASKPAGESDVAEGGWSWVARKATQRLALARHGGS